LLSLESPVWNELQTAYGEAGNIPALLSQLREFPSSGSYEDEPWYSLWSGLCHQGDIYSASFAAVPHIVTALRSDPVRADSNYFQLPACIELARVEKKVPVPVSLEKPYFEALSEFPKLAAAAATSEWSDDKCRVALAAVAVVTGKHETARLLIEVEPTEYNSVLDYISDR